MIKIYNPENLIEAQCLKDMLEHRNIFCHVSGVHLTGAIGELPATDLLGLYVTADDAGLARELIDQYISSEPVLDGLNDSKPD